MWWLKFLQQTIGISHNNFSMLARNVLTEKNIAEMYIVAQRQFNTSGVKCDKQWNHYLGNNKLFIKIFILNLNKENTFHQNKCRFSFSTVQK